MSRPMPAHDAVWVRQLAAWLERQGYPVERLFRQVGLKTRDIEADGSRVPFGKHAAFFEAAAQMTGDGCLGLHFGQTRDTRDAGLIGYVGLSSATLLDAIRCLCRYRRVFSDAVEFDGGTLEIDGRLQWWFAGMPLQPPRQCLEFGMTNLLRAFRDACGRNLVPAGVSFAHHRREHVEEFARYYGCAVRFGCPANVLEIKVSDLQSNIRFADDRLLILLRRYCREILRTHPEVSPNLIERVERAVADGLTNGRAANAIVASELGMSVRSLSRRLAALDTSFNDIVQRLRRELALKYLQEDNLSCTEIAFLLGYNEVSSFNHAFKRWTGATPSRSRRARAA